MRSLMCAIALCLVCAPGASAQGTTSDKSSKPADSYDVILQQYLRDVRATATTAPASGGVWMASLASDQRARQVNDLVTIRVIESISGLGAAVSNLDKSSTGSAGVATFFGLETLLPSAVNPANLVTTGANTTFQGGGATSRSGSLTAVLTARVAEVLPNGDLLIEGVREIEINGDRQMLVLTGVVRTADINTANVVPSTAIGQMQIRYFGRGLMKDNLSPGWLIKVLNKIF